MRRAFTIIELLVSIGIFAISSALMFGALFGATEVFRKGEAARQAGDEATAVIAALQEDLSRAVPIRLRDGEPAKEWGRVIAESNPAGNCRFSFVVENPDRAQVRWISLPAPSTSRVLVGMRKWVVWYVESAATAGATQADDLLVREEWDLSEDGTVVDKLGVKWTAASQDPLRIDVVTRGCLHFGVWLEMAEAHRVVLPGTSGPDFRWESTNSNEEVLPFRGTAFDTHKEIPASASFAAFYPQPDALRVSLVLTGGGRFATRGTLVSDISATDTTARVSGIKALPTISGSLLRIDNEWVRYDDFRNGQVIVRSDGRGALRSTATGHSGRPTVFAGQPFSLVVALPR